jgi:hypothetical protein
MKYLSIVLFILLTLSSCKKEQLSSDTTILNYSVTNLSRPGLILDEIYIDKSNHIISLLALNAIPVDSLPLSFTATLALAAGATSMPVSGGTITLSSKDEAEKYTISAENGSKVDYYVVLRDNQIPNSGFEDWYTASGLNGITYQEPGKLAATSVWATANSGTSIYNVYGTVPVVNDGNTVVQITTGVTTLVPITAGTIFTGKFDVNGALNNPTDPKKATFFGIPFSLRPSGIKFKYAFHPGSRYIRATLNNPANIFAGFTVTDIAGEDSCTAYAILETRDGANVLEVGRADTAMGDLQDVMKEILLPITYTSEEKPTHISIVFSSSKGGEQYTGAVGSTLTIDDLELIY